MAFNKWKTGGRLKLEWRYVICPLAFLIVLWVAASFTGHWATEENPYRSYALQACAWLDGRLDLGKDYPWLELAIYEGKYYVSFPPFPSLVLLPFAAVWGTNTPDHWISLGFSIIGIIYAIRLYHAITGTYEMAERYVLFLFLGNGYLFIALQGGWVWYMAQTMCFAFSLMSLFYAANKHIGRAFAFLACAFGCRPMVVAYIPLILMLGTEKASVKTWMRKGKDYPKATYYISFRQKLEGIPIYLEIGHKMLTTNQTYVTQEVALKCQRIRGIETNTLEYMDETSFILDTTWMREEKRIQEDVPLATLEDVMRALEKRIEEGYIRDIYALRLGYVCYLDDTSPDIYALYPAWICDCIYANSPREQIEKNIVTDAFRENYRYEQILVDAQTCAIQAGWIDRDEGLYHAEPMTWGKMQ